MQSSTYRIMPVSELLCNQQVDSAVCDLYIYTVSYCVEKKVILGHVIIFGGP